MSKALIAASLTVAPSPDGRELLAVEEAADWLEVRADIVGDIDPRWIRRFFSGKLIYSLRSVATGGAFEGTADKRTSRILDASAEYDLVELEAADGLSAELLNDITADRRILSWHGHATDLGYLSDCFSRLASIPSDFYKLVVEGRRIEDSLVVLRFLGSLGRSDVIAYASGQTGLWGRVIAPYLGAPVIFGCATRAASPDGEPSVFQLIEDYGLPLLRPVKELYGIVGNPVSHSLSPRIHNTAYRALEYPALFVPFQVESFGEFWREIVTSGELELLGLSIKGLTVASPCKEVALQEARISTPMCRRVRAANVFICRNGYWKADTTDPEGAMLAIGIPGLAVRGRKAAVIGCGGAGRAMAAALDQAGAAVTLVNRGSERGRLAARLLDLPFVPLSSFVVRGFSIVVNATPLGRDDNRIPFDVNELPRDAAVIDLVYGPNPTPLVTHARASGRIVIDGREVLQAQVLRQFRLMTGREMPFELASEKFDYVKGPATATLQGGTKWNI